MPSYKIMKAIIAIFAAGNVIYHLERAMQTVKKRIEYIDLAKGVCILLVVFAHIHPDLTRYSWGIFFDSFRMPLYFFLSGIFFKRYSGIQEFAIKKINNLIIPLLFFYAFAYLYDAVSWGIYHLSESDTSTYERYSWWPFWEIIRLGMTLSQPAVMVSYRPFRSKYLLLRSASVRQVMATRLRRMGHRNRRLAGSKIGYRTSLLFRNGIYIVTVFSCRYVAQTQRTTSLFLPRQISLCLDFAFGRGRMATGRTHTIA